MDNDLNPGEDEATNLTPEQDARTTALYHARGVIGAHREIGTYPAALSPDTVREVVWLAEYILTGEHYPSKPASAVVNTNRFN
jgi:hypothetical protein